MVLCWRLTFLRQGQICFPMHLYGPYTLSFILEVSRPPSCLCLLYFLATLLFTCIKSWFFRNHLAIFHQISHWSYCWNVIDSLFKWSRTIDCQAHIFFFKTKNCSDDDLFVSCDDRIGKMLHKLLTAAYLQWLSLRWASRGPWASCELCSMIWAFVQPVCGTNLQFAYGILGLSLYPDSFNIKCAGWKFRQTTFYNFFFPRK